MPELPEVEMARRQLSRWIGGGTVRAAHVVDGRGIVEGSPAATERSLRALTGSRLARVERRGKWLRLAFETKKGVESLVFSHLGMTGRWSKRAEDDPTERWERVRIDVERRGKRVSARYVDPRRFGQLVVAREDIAAFAGLGPDPLIDGVDAEALAEVLARRRLSVKEVLMDQTVLAGIGNIQATEALWRARIDPRSPGQALSSADVKAIVRGIRWTLERTLRDSEADGDDLRYVQDAGGDNPFSIYGRAGEPCPRCKTTLIRVVLGGRTTALCPGCQARRGRARARRATRAS